MKKVVAILCVTATAFVLGACDGQKKDVQKANSETELLEEVTSEKELNKVVKDEREAEKDTSSVKINVNAIGEPKDTKAAAEEILTKYEQTVKNYVDVLVKFQKGDMSVASEYQKLSQELPQISTDVYKYVSDFDAKQTKRLEAATKKYTDATKALTK